MGWGLVAASRAQLLSQCTTLDEAVRQDATIVDMCSESRRVTGGPRPRSAACVARSVCTSLWKLTRSLLVMYYDDQSRMHTQRSILWSRRYRRLTVDECRAAEAKGKVIVDGAAYSPAMVPYTEREAKRLDTRSNVVWPKLWCTKHGKKKAFELIRDAAVEWHHEHYVDGSGRNFISFHGAEPFVYPYNDTAARELATRCCASTFGEADSMVSEALKVIGETQTVNIQTIDTDMILQVLVSRNAHAWQSVRLRLLNETLDAGALTREFGGADYAKRLTAAFWMLACNGVDYCKGLTRFGYGTKTLMELARHADPILFEVLEGTARFEAGTFLTVLAATKRRRVKGQDFCNFHSEVNAMLFCLSLFSGAMHNRMPCGGPDLRTEVVTNTHPPTPFNDATIANATAPTVAVVVALGW